MAGRFTFNNLLLAAGAVALTTYVLTRGTESDKKALPPPKIPIPLPLPEGEEWNSTVPRHAAPVTENWEVSPSVTFAPLWHAVQFGVEVYPKGADKYRVPPPATSGSASVAHDCSVIVVGEVWWDRVGDYVKGLIDTGLTDPATIMVEAMKHFLPVCLAKNTPAALAVKHEVTLRIAIFFGAPARNPGPGYSTPGGPGRQVADECVTCGSQQCCAPNYCVRQQTSTACVHGGYTAGVWPSAARRRFPFLRGGRRGGAIVMRRA